MAVEAEVNKLINEVSCFWTKVIDHVANLWRNFSIFLFLQYLSFKGYTRTLATFKSERKHGSSQGAPSSSNANSTQAELLTAFECGEREAFCQLWEEHVPAHLRSRDPTCQHLECSINVYFAVYPIRTGVRRLLYFQKSHTHTHTHIHYAHPYITCRLVTRSRQCLRSGPIWRVELLTWPIIKTLLLTSPCPMFQISPNTPHSKTSSWYITLYHCL